MVSNMAQVKPQPKPDMPVFSENRPNAATIKAQRAIRAMWDELATLRAVSAKIGVSSGYLSLVLNNKRPASRELLIALGLRKERPVLTPEQRQARKERRQIANALLELYAVAHDGNEVRIVRAGVDGGWWHVSVFNLSGRLQKKSEYKKAFVEAAQEAIE